MSEVFTANVFLSTSKEAIRKIFLNNNRVSVLDPNVDLRRDFSLNDEELEKSVIVSPHTNSGLLEFEYSFNTKGAKDNGKLLLTFLETNNNFEEDFINKTASITILEKFLKRLYAAQVAPDGDFDFSTTNTPEEIKYITENLSSRNRLVNDWGKVYFSFGIGSNLENWVGPYVAVYVNSKLSVNSAGIKQITMEFFVTGAHFGSNNLEAKTSRGLDNAIDRFTRVLTHRREIAYDEIFAFNTIEELKGDNLNNACSKILENYIRNIGDTKNTLVILPELDELAVHYEKLFIDNFNRFTNMPGGYIRKPTTVKDITGENFNEIYFIEGRKDFFRTLFGWKVRNSKKVSKDIDKTQSPIPEQTTEAEVKSITANLEVVMHVSNVEEDSETRILPDYYRPIRTLIDNFKDAISDPSLGLDRSWEMVFISENNIALLELWKNYGFIDNSDEPAIILAPRLFVDNFLYLKDITSFEDIPYAKTEKTSFRRSDIKKFTNTQYRRTFFDKFVKIPYSSSFRDSRILQDELALPDNITGEYIEAGGLPLFRHNTNNPNVMSLDIDYNEQLRNLFDLGINASVENRALNAIGIENITSEASRVYSRKYIKVFKTLISSDKEFKEILNDIDFIDKYSLVKKVFKDNKKKYKTITDKFIKIGKKENLTLDSIALYLTLLLMLNYETSNKPYVVSRGNEDPAYLQKVLYDGMQNLKTMIVLKTLPFFQISGHHKGLGRSAYLVSVRNKILGSKNPKQKFNPYSGAYTIIGFRHVINTSEVFSEIQLFKNKFIDEFDDPNDNDEVLKVEEAEERKRNPKVGGWIKTIVEWVDSILPKDQ